MPHPSRLLARLVSAVFLVLPVVGFGSTPASSKPPARAAAPRRSAEELALLAIRDQAVRDVQALVERMRGLPEGSAREALERDVTAIKRQSEIDFLRAKATFARQRGDLATAQLAETALAQLVSPSRTLTGPVVAKPGEKEGER